MKKQFFQRLQLLRAYQWIKNLFVFTGLIFAGKLFEIDAFLLAFGAFLLFSLMASSVYIINDILDYEHDRIHPTKRKRPIASGNVSFSTAWKAASLLAFISLFVSFFLSVALFLILLSYLLLNLAYTKALKDIAVLDVLCISLGFILRIFAGTAIIEVSTSSWLILCTLFITLFLGFAKRKSELRIHDRHHDSSDYRVSLKHYSNKSIDILIGISATITVLSYCLYTLDVGTINRFHTDELIYTVPFVVAGILRYLYLIYQRFEGDDPTLLVIKDVPVIAIILCWMALVVLLVY